MHRLVEQESGGPIEKIAHMANGAKNHPHNKAKNRPQDALENRPNIINPVSLCGVVDQAGLSALLNSKRQSVWCSRVRVCGLLLLIDYICRKLKKDRISICADLAHQFVSKLRNKDRATTITEPLLLLCKIGILERPHPAVFAHIRTSAVYRFADPYYKKRLQIEAVLTPKLASKRECASERCEKRINRKFPWRDRLLSDLASITFSDSARPIVAEGFLGDGSENLKRIVSAIDGQKHAVRVNERGQITTSIGSCPRDLQPHLLLHGSPIAFCDISNAHWNFLPRILENRLRYVSREPGREKYSGDGWREHAQLVLLLGVGDFYRQWCVDPDNDDERNEKKTILNILLNRNNGHCGRNVLYRKIRATFPITFRTIEDLKSEDHRNLAKQLHRFTADAIAAALLEVQGQGIAAIPHVDSLICQQKGRKRVCEIVGKHIFEVTGVCGAVGGIRYSPLTVTRAGATSTMNNSKPAEDGSRS